MPRIASAEDSNDQRRSFAQIDPERLEGLALEGEAPDIHGRIDCADNRDIVRRASREWTPNQSLGAVGIGADKVIKRKIVESISALSVGRFLNSG